MDKALRTGLEDRPLWAELAHRFVDGAADGAAGTGCERSTIWRDVARRNALRAAGWTVLRFTADDVLRHPRRTVRHVATTMHELRRLGPGPAR